ncbi:LysR family transcriptional regulator [Amycolatopsis sp. YIM 10]|uniref:LysR family transcriptional regulator n=1 Tax=Amycolatopsis sp. YIM 10 TaxID=2653857 RepID=UPI0012A97788|nr:LysR family transcriptional regulator [Amycolatopsis sp. YIM 10]QFU89457.1 Hca operon transcriptional activator [Amycolatopsis sp. YIM 10]
MELRQLRYFRAVAEERNLTRAAARLHLRPTSLSQQIIALEREVGTALFVRGPNGMEPTEAGRALLPEAERTLRQAERALHAARFPAAEGLRLAVTPGSPPAVAALLARKLRQVDDLPVSAQLTRIRSGELDAGLVVLPVDPALTVAIVSTAELGVLVDSAHPLASRTEVSWADLSGNDLLWFDRALAPGYHDEVLALAKKAGWTPRRILHGPPRRALFAGALRAPDVVALRPRWSAGDGQRWLPLRDSPVVRHALVWQDSQHSRACADLAAELARAAGTHDRAVTPDGHGRPSPAGLGPST